MTLGENISRLRTERQMTQGDLAEVMEVSRQSVSKWETDASVPDLDKLVRLSQLFSVTLDELVQGRSAAEGSEPSEAPRPAPQGPCVRKPGDIPTSRMVLGGVLLAVGLVGELILTLLAGLSGLLFGAFFLSPFILCGVICLKVKRHVGLWCAWSVYVPQQIYWTYGTGLTWQTILWTAQWTPQMNYVRLITAWIMFLARVLLVVCALRSFRSLRLAPDRRTAVLLAGGCIVFLFFCLVPIPLPPLAEWSLPLSAFLSCLRLALGSALLIVTVAAVRGWKGN